MFGKRASDLTLQDIQRLVKEETQEGEDFELKESIPHKGSTPDPWVNGEDRIGDKGRNELLEEIVAFANTYGGWMVLGIEETNNHPKRASAIKPLRDCHALADKIRQQCRDCIEPHLPVIDIVGIPTEEDGFGVVVFHVQRSRMAPHRLKQTLECYRRYKDQTVKMSMREIQDLTINVERGMAAVEKLLEDRRRNFPYPGGTSQKYGLRVTALPVSPAHHFHVCNIIKPPAIDFDYQFGNKPDKVSVQSHFKDADWRPILRGIRHKRENSTIEMIECGLIEYRQIQPPMNNSRLSVSFSWMLALLLNTMCAVEMFRNAANTPNLEFAVEVELWCAGDGKYCVHGSMNNHDHASFPMGSVRFPLYSLGPREEFVGLAQRFVRDFWNAAGVEVVHDLVVDFEKAFKRLEISQ